MFKGRFKTHFVPVETGMSRCWTGMAWPALGCTAGCPARMNCGATCGCPSKAACWAAACWLEKALCCANNAWPAPKIHTKLVMLMFSSKKITKKIN